METTKIRNIGDLTEAIRKVSDKLGGGTLWWRGQAKKEWDLRPSIYHMDREKDEISLSIRFRQKAGVRHLKCPEIGDYSSWLYLMQHYHLPTRLLDWSESPLIALFFAVADERDHSSDGHLFGLNPFRFNSSQGGVDTIFFEDNDIVIPVFKEAFSLYEIDDSEKILAIVSNHSDIRQMMQQSAFTIHGKSTPLTELENPEEFLCKIEIPLEAKPSLLEDLNSLGINRSYLFPDLENLARDLKSYKFIQR